MDVNSNNKSDSDEQMMDILLVFDKEKKTINAVKGIDENGEPQTVQIDNITSNVPPISLTNVPEK